VCQAAAAAPVAAADDDGEWSDEVMCNLVDQLQIASLCDVVNCADEACTFVRYHTTLIFLLPRRLH